MSKLSIEWLNEGRQFPEPASLEEGITQERTHIFKDLGQLIHMGQFRRLSNKTQAYTDSDSSGRSQLTHSLEVANLAIQLCRIHRKVLFDCKQLPGSESSPLQKLEFNSEMEDLVQIASLSHDLGRPPFGQAGEKFLADHVSCRKFNSNIQTLRILARLHPYGHENSPNFTWSSLDSMLTEKPGGPFCKDVTVLDSERSIINSISEKTGTLISSESIAPCIEDWAAKLVKANYPYAQRMLKSLDLNKITLRHPLTFTMEMADDMSSIASDLEDALKKGYINHEDFLDACDEYRVSPLAAGSDGGRRAKWEKLLVDCHKKNNYSQIKATLLELMLARSAKNLVNALNHSIHRFGELSQTTFRDKKLNTLTYHQYLPLFFADFCFANWDGESEYGNFLYLNIPSEGLVSGKNLYDFKTMFVSDRVANTRRVAEGDEMGVRALSSLVPKLMPHSFTDVKPYLKEAKRKATYLPHEYSSFVWRKLVQLERTERVDEQRKFASDVQNCFLDFISSMTDQCVLDMAREFSEIEKPRAAG